MCDTLGNPKMSRGPNHCGSLTKNFTKPLKEKAAVFEVVFDTLTVCQPVRRKTAASFNLPPKTLSDFTLLHLTALWLKFELLVSFSLNFVFTIQLHDILVTY